MLFRFTGFTALDYSGLLFRFIWAIVSVSSLEFIQDNVPIFVRVFVSALLSVLKMDSNQSRTLFSHGLLFMQIYSSSLLILTLYKDARVSNMTGHTTALFAARFCS